MTAVAYIRRSAQGEAQASETLQRETVASLAAERGETIEHVYRDWGRSGGSENRPAYMEMLARAESNGIHAIYAYDQDRLARNIWMFSGLLRLADLKGFSIITTAGNLTDDDRRDFAEMRGVMDGGELRKITRRNKGISRLQDARGDARGSAPYGYAMKPRRQKSSDRVEFVKVDPEGIQTVIDAYKEAGTFLGAARALNALALRSKHGGGWHPKVVKAIMQREAPELVEGVTQGRRSRVKRPRLFARLLRCHCGGLMSPTSGKGYQYYYCGQGFRGRHDKPHRVSEADLLPWIKAEAALVQTPAQVLMDSESDYDDHEERAALGVLKAKGMDVGALLADLDAKRGEHGERTQYIADVPDAIDWEGWSTEAINAVLRALFTVELDETMTPVRAVWTVVQWRRAA
jgi:DNA invertase Pin-like site-specific DNA recombinase